MEFLIWLLVLLISGAGVVAQTVATSVEELQTSVLNGASARVQRLKSGGMVSALGIAGAAAWVVFVILRENGDAIFASVVAAGSILLALALALQSAARHYARSNLERLAKPLLGQVGAFLPLVEPNLEPVELEKRGETVEQMVDASEKAGLIESDEREMIAGILHLDRTLTREIMVPRIDMIAVEVETALHDALEVVIASAHSRVPVYEESIDHIVGLLYGKDLLKTLRDCQTDVALRSLLRPAYFVPESKRLDELLQELQRTKVHMAIVVDEYGGTAGIVTIEDVLEEIVGEIQDEYDTGEEPLIERVSENEGVFNARVNIVQVNEALALDLPNESDTLGGLVYRRLEKMPKVGDQVRVGDVTVSVLNVVGRRIKRVRVVKTVGSEQPMVNSRRSTAPTVH